ncbi:MAG: hypothetical protein H0Z40_00775 [Desulfotomaculum sp.]|nr:hypothetical protein [Desulfotomaculum sp.]
MLDREYEQYLKNCKGFDNPMVDLEKEHALWLVTASSIIIPALIYLNKI